MPMGTGAPIITSPGTITDESAPVELLPAEPSGSGGATPGNSAPAGTNPTGSQGAGKAVYETYKTNDGPIAARRGTSTPAEGAARNGPDPLADLPRIEVPLELTEIPSTVAPDARELPSKPTAAEEVASAPTPTATSIAPGFRHFKVVEPRLAGGSLPGENGWTWLHEQGYKTVLDLRPSHELRSEDLAKINNSGLRYVAMPTTDALIEDAAQIARFTAEIAQESARPIYFFDTTGGRASVVWYLHQVASQKSNPVEAARVAAEIGPRDEALWLRAQTLVTKLQPTNTAPSAPASPTSNNEVVPTDLLKDEKTTEPRPAPATSKDAEQPKSQHSLGIPSIQTYVAELTTPRSTRKLQSDPTAWKPIAALVAAGLSVPIGFIGRSMLGRVASLRASLPAPATAPRAIAAASGE